MQEWRSDEEVARDSRLLSPMKLEAALLLLTAVASFAVALITFAQSL